MELSRRVPGLLMYVCTVSGESACAVLRSRSRASLVLACFHHPRRVSANQRNVARGRRTVSHRRTQRFRPTVSSACLWGACVAAAIGAQAQMPQPAHTRHHRQTACATAQGPNAAMSCLSESIHVCMPESHGIQARDRSSVHLQHLAVSPQPPTASVAASASGQPSVSAQSLGRLGCFLVRDPSRGNEAWYLDSEPRAHLRQQETGRMHRPTGERDGQWRAWARTSMRICGKSDAAHP
jgi:hypothetical protein